MKQLLFTLSMVILFMGSLLAQGEKAPNAVDADGKKHGKWEVEFPKSGVVRYRGEFDHGQPVGTFFYYYESGERSSQVDYQESGEAMARFFHQNGTVMGEGKYIDQQKHGEWKFYDSQTILSSVENFSHGKLEGVTKIYHLNGQLAAEVPYVDGRKNGPFKEYTTTGKVLREGTYQDNTYDGEFKQYYDNGNIYIEGKYKAAVKDGLWVEYDDDGRIMVQRLYEEGDLVKERIEEGYEKKKFDELKEEDIIPEEKVQQQLYERGGGPPR